MTRTHYCVVLLTIALLPSLVLANEASELEPWATYGDPLYSFTMSYPPSWTIIERPDQAESYGGVLTFADPGSKMQVVVGLHTTPIKEAQSLADWSMRYQIRSTTFDLSELSIETAAPVESMVKAGMDAYAVGGVSPLTRYRITHVRHGEGVWFVWTNAEADQIKIYDRMVASLELSAATPKTLSEAFGPSFQIRNRESTHILKGELPAKVSYPPTSHWIVPIYYSTTYSVLCGSSYHTGRAAYAADVQMPLNTRVASTFRSWVDFAGWDSTGYGNLLMASTDFVYPDVYTAAYAHLSSFAVSPGQELGAGSYIAKSGNSGPSSIHLHFHIRKSNDPVHLGSLTNFDENGLYPSGWGTCGSMYR